MTKQLLTAFLCLTLFAWTAAGAELTQTIGAKTKVVDINGQALEVDAYAPKGVQTGAAILAHGFTRSQISLAEHAQALAAQGVLTLTPDMPCTFDFFCNARAIAQLVNILRDTETFGVPAQRVMLVRVLFWSSVSVAIVRLRSEKCLGEGVWQRN